MFTTMSSISNNSLGANFLYPWPKLRNLFTESELQSAEHLLKNACNSELVVHVSEKFDGCNVCLSSQDYVASRRKIIKEPNEPDLLWHKRNFFKRTLGGLAEDLKIVTGTMLQYFAACLLLIGERAQASDSITDVPEDYNRTSLSVDPASEENELLIYGEWMHSDNPIVDKRYKYEERGILYGKFYAFGMALRSSMLKSQSAMDAAIKAFRERKLAVISFNRNNGTVHFGLNAELKNIFSSYGLKTVPTRCMSVKNLFGFENDYSDLMEKVKSVTEAKKVNGVFEAPSYRRDEDILMNFVRQSVEGYMLIFKFDDPHHGTIDKMYKWKTEHGPNYSMYHDDSVFAKLGKSSNMFNMLAFVYNMQLSTRQDEQNRLKNIVGTMERLYHSAKSKLPSLDEYMCLEREQLKEERPMLLGSTAKGVLDWRQLLWDEFCEEMDDYSKISPKMRAREIVTLKEAKQFFEKSARVETDRFKSELQTYALSFLPSSFDIIDTSIF